MDVTSAWTGDVGWGLFPDAASGGRTLWQPCSGLAQEGGTCMSAQAPIEDTRPAPRPGGLRMRRRLLTVPLAILAQRQLGHADLAITSRYLRGIDNTEIIQAVHQRPEPMIPAGRELLAGR